MKRRNQRGAVTIEATIALTAFLFMFMMLYSVVTICRAETKIGIAVNNAAKEISQYSYVYSLTGLNDSEAAINAGAQGTKDKINDTVSSVADTFDAIQTLRSDGEKVVDTVSSAEEKVEKATNIDYTSWDTIGGQLVNASNEVTDAYGQVKNQAGQISTDVDSVLSSGKEVQKSLEAMAENPKELMFGLAKILATQTVDVAKSRLIAEPVSRALVKKNLKRSPSDNAEACLQALGVVPGKNFFGERSFLHGLDFSHSLLFPKGQEDIIIIVKYKLRLFQYLPIKIEFNITQTAATLGWFNGDGADKVPGSSGTGATPVSNTSTVTPAAAKVTPTPASTSEADKNAEAVAGLTKEQKQALLKDLKKKYGNDIDRIYKDYGIEALYLINKYGEDAYLLISEYGADSIRVIRNYGNKGISVLVNNEADFLETVQMINQYGKDAIDIISKYKKDGLYVLYVYGKELVKQNDAQRKVFIEDKCKDAKDKNKVISSADKAKINQWKYKPTDEDYLKYKKTYDNSDYFNQKTGDYIYPGTENPVTHKVDKNKDGFTNGVSKPDKLEKGKVYTRYGDNGSAKYFSAENVPLEQRSLPPGTEKKPLVKITILKDIPCSSGEIAPWFDQPGGGIQYYTDQKIKALDGRMVDATMENLEANKYITIEIVKK